MFKPIEIKALPNYKIWLRYSDGIEGEVDLSDLAGKGVFKLWDNYDNFEKVYIGSDGQIAWSEEIDLCPDSLYLDITGLTPEDVFPNLHEMNVAWIIHEIKFIQIQGDGSCRNSGLFQGFRNVGDG